MRKINSEYFTSDVPSITDCADIAGRPSVPIADIAELLASSGIKSPHATLPLTYRWAIHSIRRVVVPAGSAFLAPISVPAPLQPAVRNRYAA